MVKKGKIRNLIFDFGGVIVDLNIGATVEAFARLGVDAHNFIGLSRHGGLFADLELGRIDEEGFYKGLEAIAEEFHLPERELRLSPQLIRQAWCEMLQRVPMRRLKALRKLTKNYHIALLSNTNDIHWQHSIDRFFSPQDFDPKEVFEHVFLSQRLHLCKPNSEIFEEVLRQSGYKPEETLFIDDSAENCKAFAALGVETFCPKMPDDWLPKVATIGFFDGVHRGHRCLIDQVKEEAEKRAISSMIITFDKHPRKVLETDYQPQLLSTLEEKKALLEDTGIDVCRVLPFTHEMSQLSAREFMQQVLRDELNVEVLVMGYDHKFGHGGGSAEQYKQWGREVGIEVVTAHEMEGTKTSSSVIRHALSEGNVEEANALLGHCYTLSGHVVEGRQVGHTLGFPTANVQLDEEKLPPAAGVYAVWVDMPEGCSLAGIPKENTPTSMPECRRLMGMLNIGHRPTLNNGSDTTYEVNILDYDGNLYGQHLTLHLVSRLRSEENFDSLERLKTQIKADEERVREKLKAES